MAFFPRYQVFGVYLSIPLAYVQYTADKPDKIRTFQMPKFFFFFFHHLEVVSDTYNWTIKKVNRPGRYWCKKERNQKPKRWHKSSHSPPDAYVLSYRLCAAGHSVADANLEKRKKKQIQKSPFFLIASGTWLGKIDLPVQHRKKRRQARTGSSYPPIQQMHDAKGPSGRQSWKRSNNAGFSFRATFKIQGNPADSGSIINNWINKAGDGILIGNFDWETVHRKKETTFTRDPGRTDNRMFLGQLPVPWPHQRC